MVLSRRSLLAGMSIVPLAAGLAACSSSSGTSSDGKPKLVASTNVWALVAAAVAGSDADVSSIIDQPDQDPHDYEATARDKLAMQQAAVVVVNGGGYDDWATTLAGSEVTVVNAVTTSGLPGVGGADFNEHVWYSMATVAKVATAIATALGNADSAHAAAYKTRAAQFGTEVTKLATAMKQFGTAHPGVKALMTEPVSGYLLQQYGYTDATPTAFIEQSEADDVSPATLSAAKTALTSKAANLLIVNPQTSTSVTEQLIATAKSASVPTAQVRETASDETTFAAFVATATDSIQKAVTSA